MNRLRLTPIPIFDVLACTKRLILGGFNYLSDPITAEILRSAELQLDLCCCIPLVLPEPSCAAACAAWPLQHPGCSNRLLQQQEAAGRWFGSTALPVRWGAVETEVNKLLTLQISQHLGLLSLSLCRISQPLLFIKSEQNIYSLDIQVLLKWLFSFCWILSVYNHCLGCVVLFAGVAVFAHNLVYWLPQAIKYLH